jgi:hypothetical protein
LLGRVADAGRAEGGVRAVIADGPVRDIDEARDLGFPIFTNRLTCYTARSRVVERAPTYPLKSALWWWLPAIILSPMAAR